MFLLTIWCSLFFIAIFNLVETLIRTAIYIKWLMDNSHFLVWYGHEGTDSIECCCTLIKERKPGRTHFHSRRDRCTTMHTLFAPKLQMRPSHQVLLRYHTRRWNRACHRNMCYHLYIITGTYENDAYHSTLESLGKEMRLSRMGSVHGSGDSRCLWIETS